MQPRLPDTVEHLTGTVRFFSRDTKLRVAHPSPWGHSLVWELSPFGMIPQPARITLFTRYFCALNNAFSLAVPRACSTVSKDTRSTLLQPETAKARASITIERMDFMEYSLWRVGINGLNGLNLAVRFYDADYTGFQVLNLGAVDLHQQHIEWRLLELLPDTHFPEERRNVRVVRAFGDAERPVFRGHILFDHASIFVELGADRLQALLVRREVICDSVGFLGVHCVFHSGLNFIGTAKIPLNYY